MKRFLIFIIVIMLAMLTSCAESDEEAVELFYCDDCGAPYYVAESDPDIELEGLCKECAYAKGYNDVVAIIDEFTEGTPDDLDYVSLRAIEDTLAKHFEWEFAEEIVEEMIQNDGGKVRRIPFRVLDGFTDFESSVGTDEYKEN